MGQKRIALIPEIVIHGDLGGFAKWHKPFFPSLAENPDHPRTIVDLPISEIHEFARPHSGGIKQFENGLVPDFERIFAPGIGAKERFDLFESERFRIANRLFRSVDHLEGVDAHITAFDRKSVKSPQSGHPSLTASSRDAIPEFERKPGPNGLLLHFGETQRILGEVTEKLVDVPSVGIDRFWGIAPFIAQVIEIFLLGFIHWPLSHTILSHGAKSRQFLPDFLFSRLAKEPNWHSSAQSKRWRHARYRR